MRMRLSYSGLFVILFLLAAAWQWPAAWLALQACLQAHADVLPRFG